MTMPGNNSEHGSHDYQHLGLVSGHDHSHDLRGTSKRNLLIALVLVFGYMFAEIIGGILSGSLALIAGAGHLATDAAAIALALLAMRFAEKAATAERTYGHYRFEILAALLNALTLWVVAAGVIYEAYHRFYDMDGHEIEGLLMLSVGAVGLVVNITAAWVLHRSAEHSVNVEGVFRHVMADLLGAVAVVISGILIWAFEWTITDPILSVFISLIIIRGTWRLLAKVVHVLLEGTPEHIDVYKLCSTMEELEGVTLVHDIHVWTISPGNEALTAHVLTDPDYFGDLNPLLRRLREIASRDFGIGHVTIQLEQSASDCPERHHVNHLLAHARPGK